MANDDVIIPIIEDPQSMLRMALEKRNIRDFKLALNMGAKPNLKVSQHSTAFEKALQTKGCVEFVKECLKKNCDPYYVNPQNNKSALSYAADSRDPQILETLLSHKKIELNKKYAELTPLNSLAKNITDGNAEDVIKCIELLLQKGASLNIPDQREMTPILYVIKNKQLSMERKNQLIKILLNHPEIDLDTFGDAEARLRLENEFPDIELPMATSPEVNKGLLCKLLQNSNEEEFLKSFRSYKQNISEEDKDLLIVAIEKGLHKAFDVILESNEEFLNDSKVIKNACIWGNSVALEKLLKHKNLKLPIQENLLSIVIRKMQDVSYWSFCDYKKCFYILLDSDDIKKTYINKTDSSGSTALHYAVKYRNKLVIQELLKCGEYIGLKSKVINEINPDILEEYFDKCITKNKVKPDAKTFEIIIKYNNLIPPQSSICDEMTSIANMAKCKEMRHLLKHPLITSFMFLKWHRLSFIFYINLLVYSLFSVFIVIDTILKFGESENYESSRKLQAIHYLSWIGKIYLIGRETLQAFAFRLEYLKFSINYLKVILIILCIYSVTDQQTSKGVAVIIMLLLSVGLCQLMQSLPVLSISTYMLMLQAVLKSFLKCFALSSIFLITFSLCFYITFGEAKPTQGNNMFSNPLTALIKTITMLTGEFDTGNMNFDSFYSYCLFVLFVIFMSIVLFNLITGLAVSDTHEIKEQAELNGSICRAELLSYCERLSTGLKRPKVLTKVFPNTSISILPNSGNKINEMRFEMDSNILKMAIAVIERRDAISQEKNRQQVEENRLQNIGDKIEQIFEIQRRSLL